MAYRGKNFVYCVCSLLISFVVLFVSSEQQAISQAATQSTNNTRRVNVPNLSGVPFTPSIFWFGRVDRTNNYADVRVWYYDDLIKIFVNVIDRALWTDNNRSVSDLPNWDAISLYFDTSGNPGITPSFTSYRFDRELNGLHAEYQGNGSAWSTAPILIVDTPEVQPVWRGVNGPNSGGDDKGWQATFAIPFSSLGVSSPPSLGTIWGFSVILHDRDNLDVTDILNTSWPEQINPNNPSTWGQLRYGIPGYSFPPAIGTGSYIIRQGLDNTTVPDGEVGGHTICGDPYGPDYWDGWGNANYAGINQINTQNQWDIADWPCFSKYFVNFPLDKLPAGKTILSATLTMYLFGTAGGGEWGPPPDSFIHVFTINEDWNETTLTWNNAPLGLENIAGAWVHPITNPGHDVPYSFNVSRAVAEAYATHQPLRLVLYSADSERHSGKYFWSSDSNEWDGTVRPTLQVTIGDLCDSSGVVCKTQYLPLIVR